MTIPRGNLWGRVTYEIQDKRPRNFSGLSQEKVTQDNPDILRAIAAKAGSKSRAVSVNPTVSDKPS